MSNPPETLQSLASRVSLVSFYLNPILEDVISLLSSISTVCNSELCRLRKHWENPWIEAIAMHCFICYETAHKIFYNRCNLRQNWSQEPPMITTYGARKLFVKLLSTELEDCTLCCQGSLWIYTRATNKRWSTNGNTMEYGSSPNLKNDDVATRRSKWIGQRPNDILNGTMVMNIAKETNDSCKNHLIPSWHRWSKQHTRTHTHTHTHKITSSSFVRQQSERQGLVAS